MSGVQDSSVAYNVKNWETLAEDVIYRIDKLEFINGSYLSHLSYQYPNAGDDCEHFHAWLYEMHVRKFIDELNQSNTLFFVKANWFGDVTFEFVVYRNCRQKTFVHPSVKRALNI